ncbi:hypothetical protein N431DRAFT_437883 [Stipitochalara longipes BDJ]|nr:hypothetical protein N431DRAFT_437883 [Stipitochalara longipes BDJ]
MQEGEGLLAIQLLVLSLYLPAYLPIQADLLSKQTLTRSPREKWGETESRTAKQHWLRSPSTPPRKAVAVARSYCRDERATIIASVVKRTASSRGP